MKERLRLVISRRASASILKLAQQYSVVVITGPRQAGKSTLSKALFPNKPYISLEDLDERAFAQSDPRGFLNRFPEGGIFDEIQRCPDLLSYIQTRVDQRHIPGEFILTGSAQLSLLSSVSQSLAGRAAIHQLLPFSLYELDAAQMSPSSLDELLFQGCYPPLYDRKLDSQTWLSNYTQTYVERDVRQVLNIQDLSGFSRFLKLCAGRAGQLLNLSSLGADCGISHTTASHWLTVLEATYIVFRLQPFFKNFSKRLVKTPKLYFYDSGLLCSLLGIQSAEQVVSHSQRGAIFEGWVLSEMTKKIFDQQQRTTPYFWRDHKGLEVDIIMERPRGIAAVEIKSGMTIADDWFEGLKKLKTLALGESIESWLVYGGDASQTRQHAQVLSWRAVDSLFEVPKSATPAKY